jgi:hypothetical protein
VRQASFEAVIGPAGQLVNVRVLDKGKGYGANPKCSVYGPGHGAVVQAQTNATGEVMTIQILEGGIGYVKGMTWLVLEEPSPTYHHCHLCCRPPPEEKDTKMLQARLDAVEQVLLSAVSESEQGEQALQRALREADPRYRAIPLSLEIGPDGRVQCGGKSYPVQPDGTLVIDGVSRPLARLTSTCSIEYTPVLPVGARILSPEGFIELPGSKLADTACRIDTNGQVTYQGEVKPDWVVRPDGSCGPAPMLPRADEVPVIVTQPPRALSVAEQIEQQEKAATWSNMLREEIAKPEVQASIQKARALLPIIEKDLRDVSQLNQFAESNKLPTITSKYTPEFEKKVRRIADTPERVDRFLQTADLARRASCLDRYRTYTTPPEDLSIFEDERMGCALFPSLPNPDLDPSDMPLGLQATTIE